MRIMGIEPQELLMKVHMKVHCARSRCMYELAYFTSHQGVARVEVLQLHTARIAFVGVVGVYLLNQATPARPQRRF